MTAIQNIILMSHLMYVIKHLLNIWLCMLTSIAHKNDDIISLSNFTELLAWGSCSIEKLDNDYDIIFMCYKCNIT